MLRTKDTVELTAEFSEQILWLANSCEQDAPIISGTLYKNVNRYAFAAGAIAGMKDAQQLDVLDWGCGLPILSYLLKDRVRSQIAYEPFASAVHREFAQAHEIQFLETLPQQGSCDVISLIEVIEHLPILGDVIPKIASCLRPGGCLLLTTPNGLRFESYRKYLFRKTAHPVPINAFLRNTNTYELHQREFTSHEIRETMSYFDFDVQWLMVKDLSPSLQQLSKFREVTGQEVVKPKCLTRCRRKLISWLPSSWQSTLVCCARKR